MRENTLHSTSQDKKYETQFIDASSTILLCKLNEATELAIVHLCLIVS